MVINRHIEELKKRQAQHEQKAEAFFKKADLSKNNRDAKYYTTLALKYEKQARLCQHSVARLLKTTELSGRFREVSGSTTKINKMLQKPGQIVPKYKLGKITNKPSVLKSNKRSPRALTIKDAPSVPKAMPTYKLGEVGWTKATKDMTTEQKADYYQSERRRLGRG